MKIFINIFSNYNRLQVKTYNLQNRKQRPEIFDIVLHHSTIKKQTTK